ncbi:MAG: hypothetical protein ACM3PY_18470, partial [Omnitrophica WOR_2 bacterium]
MQFRIDVIQDGEGWSVYVTDLATGSHPPGAGGQPLVRSLRRRVESGILYPLPPLEEAQAIPPNTLHYELCNPGDPNTLNDA